MTGNIKMNNCCKKMTSLFVVGIKYPVSKEEYSRMLNKKKHGKKMNV